MDDCCSDLRIGLSTISSGENEQLQLYLTREQQFRHHFAEAIAGGRGQHLGETLCGAGALHTRRVCGCEGGGGHGWSEAQKES